MGWSMSELEDLSFWERKWRRLGSAVGLDSMMMTVKAIALVA